MKAAQGQDDVPIEVINDGEVTALTAVQKLGGARCASRAWGVVKPEWVVNPPTLAARAVLRNRRHGRAAPGRDNVQVKVINDGEVATLAAVQKLGEARRASGAMGVVKGWRTPPERPGHERGRKVQGERCFQVHQRSLRGGGSER